VPREARGVVPLTLTLILTENAGFGFAEINKLAPHLSMKGEAFRLKMI